MPSPDPDSRFDHWFEPIAHTLGSAYLRYSFTLGTAQETRHLIEVLDLGPGARVLDVGCGPGRHAHALGAEGVSVHGIDISARFIEIARRDAPDGVTFERLDARALEDHRDLHGAFDAAICLCQGAFGLMTDDGDDLRVLTGIARCLRPGAMVALTAFNAYFAVKYHEQAAFDADSGIAHERTEVRDEDGNRHDVDLWTGCYTPRELRLLFDRAGLVVRSVSAVEPGAYSHQRPSTESPEFLVIAQRPSSGPAA